MAGFLNRLYYTFPYQGLFSHENEEYIHLSQFVSATRQSSDYTPIVLL